MIQKKTTIDEISEMLINSLPQDAENLSTLTGWQAQEVIKNFLIKLNNYDKKENKTKKAKGD